MRKKKADNVCGYTVNQVIWPRVTMVAVKSIVNVMGKGFLFLIEARYWFVPC